MKTSIVIRRGDLLRCTTAGPHFGQIYLFERIMAGNVTDAAGNPIPNSPSYVFNLVNLSTGKMRQTENHRMLTSGWIDGIKTGFLPYELSQHYRLQFERIGNMQEFGETLLNALNAHLEERHTQETVYAFLEAVAEHFGVGIQRTA